MALLTRAATRARRAGGSLVVTFGRAEPPLIWRFDLEHNHSFTLALRESGEGWELGTTSPEGAFHAVACFSSQKDAEEAFASVSRVLAGGGLAWAFGFMKILAVLILLFVLAALAASFLLRPNAVPPGPAATIDPPASFSDQDDPQPPVSNPQAAVPVPADSVLKPPATP